MYKIVLTPGDADFLRELVEFVQDILDDVDLADEIKRQRECE